jgi:predicted XRE-type DNA-binding protein
MQIKDLSQKVTSKKLNESLAKTFGYKLKLEQFSDIQLEDVRNKLRTELSQMEMNESYDNILENSKYQKTRALLDVVNQAIFEREEAASIEVPVTKQVSEHAMATAISQRAKKLSVPESWIKNAIKRIQLGESDRAELSAEVRLRYDLSAEQASWMLLEGEEQKAENILATKDMVSKVTNWIEDTAAMKADQLLELLDSIRAEQGSAVSTQFNQVASQALEGVYTALVSAREGLSQALALVSGEQEETMGAEVPGAGMPGAEPGLPGEEPGAEIPSAGGPEGIPGEEEALPPPADEAGRMKRESIEYSRKLGLLLSSKKK